MSKADTLTQDDRILLRDIVRQHRPQSVSLLHALGQQSMSLRDRHALAMALMCELFQRGYEIRNPSDERDIIWRLSVCVKFECHLHDESINLLRQLVMGSNPSLLKTLNIESPDSWTDAQRQHIAQIVRHEYQATQSDESSKIQVLSIYGTRVRNLRRYIWTSTPLAQQDLLLLREVIERWEPDVVSSLDSLGVISDQANVRNHLYDAINAEIQATRVTDPNSDERINRLNDLIDYIGHL